MAGSNPILFHDRINFVFVGIGENFMKKCAHWVLILSLLILSGCSPPSSESPPLRIGIYTVWPTSGIAFIAQEHGLFAKYEVPVTLVSTPDYLETGKLYQENKVDITDATLIDAIVFHAMGKATNFIYAIDYSETADVIVGQPTLNNLTDLKGKKVSFEGFNSFSHLLVLKLLEQAGLKEGDFQTANIGVFDVIGALETGEIDAGHVYGRTIPDALAKGYKILGKAGDFPYLITDGFAVNADILKTRSQDVQGVVNALTEATDWFVQFPEEG
jgi:NitT/TauT family transport system substrate-binding protein